jgi:hypothetical protein
MRSCCLGSAGFANQEVALNGRLGTLSLLAHCVASLARLSSREVVCVKRRRSGIRCSIHLRIGGSATGVLITDNYHETTVMTKCAP